MKKVVNKRNLSLEFRCLACAALVFSSAAQAVKIGTGNSDINLRWDNTVKYSTAFRLQEQSEGLNTPDDNNQDDGNQNFDKGLVSNRLDLFSEFDGSYKSLGFRVSGAAWYDDVYHQETDNDSLSLTANRFDATEFSDDAKEIMGGYAEVLDAFIYSRIPLGDATATVRLGRHTILWGESLFFGANGMAAGMAPIDLIKLLSVPGAQFKEVARPLGKLSAEVPINERLSISGYYGYEWEKSRFAPAGAYLSFSDVIEGERIITGPLSTGAPTFERQDDLEPSQTGQYGLALRWSSGDFAREYGLYATRSHSFSFNANYLALSAPPVVEPDTHRWAYHEGIESIGASMSTSVGSWSLAGEMSYRQNAPLNSTPILAEVGGVTFNNTDNPGYAVGSTAHAQVNWLATFGPSFISREAAFLGEVAWNQRVGVDKNEELLNPHADKSAVATRLIYSPTYRQLFSGFDLSPRISVGYTWGASSALGPGFGVNEGGELNVGLSSLYRSRWKITLNYISYFGPEGGSLDENNLIQFKQALKDRDFVSFSVSTTL